MVARTDPKKPDANSGMERLDAQMQTLVRALGLSFAKERAKARERQRADIESIVYRMGQKHALLQEQIDALRGEVAQLRAEQARTPKAKSRTLRRAA
jgi:polyhydroxyalkanoate synthesis regulator phasin